LQSAGWSASRHTQNSVHRTLPCHERYAAQNHNINIANKTMENIVECFITQCPKCYPVQKPIIPQYTSNNSTSFHLHSATLPSIFLFPVPLLSCHQFPVFSNTQNITTSLSSLCTSSSVATSLIFLVPLLHCH